jgi:HlyD family secretion protein
VPDIREGDQVQPGIPVADVLDLSELEVIARVGELDRANLREGQDVMISLDAIAEKQFKGTIKSMSGTASANMFSSDPAKKFDVIFSIDMRQLLAALGTKPAVIKRIMATAEQNRKKPPMQAAPSMLSTMGGGGGGSPMSGGQGQGGAVVMQAPGGAMQASGGAQGGGGQAAAAASEDAKKMRDAVQKALAGRAMRDLSPEDRQKVMQQAMKAAGIKPPAAAAPGGMQLGFNRPGGAAGAPGSDAATPGQPARFSTGSGQFSENDLQNAKLPPPPEEESQLDVLLRPGLLADIEIIVDRVPQALNLPNQAVFEKDGKPVVYVKVGNRYEDRAIKIAKRSESITIIEAGVKENEIVALADPTAKPGDSKKKKSEEKGGGNAMGSLPAGGK